ncbi:T9SS type A sorting domain-containing protein [Halpernia sp.]|uniref:T9SS type A sorting domain-containing protein n=1 Tax=Halpernia sp. TaxID=2782209 RepID=UPI003A8F9BB8
MRKILLVLTALLFCSFTYAQIVNIPDVNFKAYLVGNSSINTNGDNEIQISEANNYTGQIYCPSKNIADLTGIEYFVKLTNLWCSKNQLTNLNVSKNIALTDLYCDGNQLTNLDVSKNVALQNFLCYENQLTNLDVTTNNAIRQLECDQNKLTTLNVSKNTALKVLTCYDNQLTNLDVSKNTALTTLFCDSNQLTSLDVTKNTALTSFICAINKLTSLDVSKNTALKSLVCFQNQLKNLDVSKNVALNDLRCNNNQLFSLNVKNGQNSKITTFNATVNPNLTCIQVDDIAYSTSNWLNKDSWATYNINCNYMSVSDIQKSKLKLYPNPVKNTLNIQTENKFQKIEIYSINGQLIKTSFQKETNVSELPKGNFLVTVTTDKGVQTEKIIKE